MKYNIVLLNYGITDINGTYFTKIEYCFSRKENYIESVRINGVIPLQMYLKGNLKNHFKLSDIFNEYEIEGIEVADIKKPLNKKFKPIKITNLTTKYVIDLLEQK